MKLFSKNKITAGLFVFLVIANIISLTALWYTLYKKDIPVHHPMMRMSGGKPDVMNFLCNRLDLDSSQIKIFERLRSQHFNQINSVNENIFTLKQELFTEIFRDNPDSLKINELTEKIGDFYGKKEKVLAGHFLDLKKVCKADQCKEFRNLVERTIRRRPDSLHPDKFRRRVIRDRDKRKRIMHQ